MLPSLSTVVAAILPSAYQKTDKLLRLFSQLKAMNDPPMIADELRRQADAFIDLRELQSKIGRDSSARSAPRNHSPQFVHRHTPIPRPGDDVDPDG